MNAQPQKITYTANQRRALLSADLDTGHLPIVDQRGHGLHSATRNALETKGLAVYVLGADHYHLTELGLSEARRLQAERQARSARRRHESHGKAHLTHPQRAVAHLQGHKHNRRSDPYRAAVCLTVPQG